MPPSPINSGLPYINLFFSTVRAQPIIHVKFPVLFDSPYNSGIQRIPSLHDSASVYKAPDILVMNK